ncbi:MAG: hypothetical protein Q4C13_07145, partial [Clostridia bacterium]|nr:hypothetical protein [Clostridia bacterium]
RRTIPLYPEKNGYIAAMRAEGIGRAAQMLGAGRAAKTDRIDPAVGLVMHARVGDAVGRDRPLCTLYVNDESRLAPAMERLRAAVQISEAPPAPSPMVYGVIGGGAV